MVQYSGEQLEAHFVRLVFEQTAVRQVDQQLCSTMLV